MAGGDRSLRGEQFQFPTGWNSTTEFLAANADEICFNSQRDGILQKEKRGIYNVPYKFQFPTGWNSTLKNA